MIQICLLQPGLILASLILIGQMQIAVKTAIGRYPIKIPVLTAESLVYNNVAGMQYSPDPKAEFTSLIEHFQRIFLNFPHSLPKQGLTATPGFTNIPANRQPEKPVNNTEIQRTSPVEKDNSVRIMILDDSVNDIQMVVNQLRNAGLAVHSVTAEDTEEFEAAIQSGKVDLVICNDDTHDPSLMQAIEMILAAEKDIPVIALDSEFDVTKVGALLKHGARDYVSKQSPDHIAHVVKREFEDLQVRRKLRKQEAVVHETEKRCQSLLDNSRDAIAYVHEGMHIYANNTYLEMFGFEDGEDLEGIPIMDMVAPEEHAMFKDFLKRYAKEDKKTETLEVKGMRPDNSTFNAAMEFSPAAIDGEPCTQIIIRVQTADKDLEDKLKYLSKQDVLTGLYNRQYFLEELEQAIIEAASGSHNSSLLYIEPDDFKKVRETVGLAGADLLIGDISLVLKEHMSEQTIAARFSDNSFTLLIPGDDPNYAREIAEQIRGDIAEHVFETADRSVTLTTSIGISFIGETAVSAQEILSKADLACEMMHKEGGNKIHLHNPVADLRASKDRAEYLDLLLREALENNDFQLAFQPIASLHGDTTERYEVLVRMHDKDGKEILPGEFLPIAEENNMIMKIDRWIFNQSIKALCERRASGKDTILFLNVSPRTLMDDTLLPWISAMLKKSHLPGDALVFEISEQTAVSHLKFAKVFAQGLQQLHCGFSLDDFGNGMNSFQLLKHLPVNYLKIGGSFMHNLAEDEQNQNMIKSIVEMATKLKKPVIAKYVEDANSLSVLWGSGIQFIQGHFLQKPEHTMHFDFSGEADEEQRLF